MQQLEIIKGKKPRPPKPPKEWKLIAVRECPTPEEMQHCDTPQKAVDYWRLHIEGHPFFDLERECFVVIVLNTRLRIRGHYFMSIGSLNECVVHPRDVFRVAVLSSAYAVVFAHNHPSGEPQPSDADRSVTKRLIEAAGILGIVVIDHVIVATVATAP